MALATEGKTAIIPLEDTHVTIPSAIFYTFQRHRFSFGRAAVLIISTDTADASSARSSLFSALPP